MGSVKLTNQKRNNRMYLKLTALSLILFVGIQFGMTQVAPDSEKPKSLNVSGYVEAYYIYDFANPSDHNRPDFFYAFDRHNEINVNLAQIELAYEQKRVKGNLALMTGTYASSNLAHEPAIYRMISEASVSYKVSKKSETWLTAGVFPSHIGFESAVGADCWNLTRSLAAENSPYYLAGAKLYTTAKNKKWDFGLTVANGWQRIQRLSGNQLMGVGHQVTYRPNDKWTINSSSYVGSEFPDSIRRMRYFHDFYAISELSDKFSLLFGFDIGVEQQSKGSSEYNMWYVPTLLAKYDVSPKFSIGARLEHYSDENEVIISTNDGNGFSLLGYSLNLDFQLTEQFLFRLEGRSLHNQRAIYTVGNGTSKNNVFVGTSMALRLK